MYILYIQEEKRREVRKGGILPGVDGDLLIVLQRFVV